MDETVIAAMARWPNVPAVYGWLSLTARGEWRIKGEAIPNEAIRAFISRNYTNEAGRWYFQNGPQRVFVALELAPFVFRIDSASGRACLVAQTGATAGALKRSAWIVDGPLLVDTDIGPGNIDDRDSEAALAALCDQQARPLSDDDIARWLQGSGAAFLDPAALGLEGTVIPVERLARERVAEHFGYDADPRAG